MHAAGRRSLLIGNIGTPAAIVIDQLTDADIVIYEMSSYMLAQTVVHPDIGVLLNLYPEHHLRWHGGVEQYRSDKRTILDHASYEIC